MGYQWFDLFDAEIILFVHGSLEVEKEGKGKGRKGGVGKKEGER